MPKRSWIFASVPLLYLASFVAGWFCPPSLVGIGDWDWVFSDAWVSARGLIERGWPAWWSIQLDGGAPLLGNPESLAASPFLVFPLVFGPVIGIKVLVALLLVVGFAVCLKLGMRWIGEPLGATTFAFLFVFSGYFAIHLRAGHFPWAMFYLVPAVFLFADELLVDGNTTPRASIGFVGSLVLLVFGAVYHPLVFFLAPLVLVYGFVRRDAPVRRVRYVALLTLCAAAISVPRVAAALEWQLKSPRYVAGHGGLSVAAMISMLLVPIADYKERVPLGSGIWEYWAYVGSICSLLAIGSCLLRRAWRVTAIASIVVGVVLAWRSPWGTVLDSLSSFLPLVASMRVCSRFLGLVVFGVALAAGGTLAVLREKLSGRLAWIPIAIALAIVGEHCFVVWPIWSRVFDVPVTEAYPQWGSAPDGPTYSQVHAAPPFQDFTAARDMYNSRMLPLLMAGYIVPNAYTALTLPHIRLSAGPVVRESPPGLRCRIGNDTIELEGDLRPDHDVKLAIRPVRHGWKVDDRSCARIENQQGEMKIVMLTPCNRVRLSFRSGGEIAYWIVAAMGLAASIALIRISRRGSD